jgi:Mg2+-importing ATPase
MNQPLSFSAYTTLSVDQVLKQLESDGKIGLGDHQVQERQKRYGANSIDAHTPSWLAIVWRQMHSSFIYLLIGAAIISFFLKNTTEGFVIIGIVALNTLIGFYQEYRASKVVQLLKHYLRPQVRVIRNGIEVFIETIRLVPGDIVVLYPGDKVPADLRIIWSQSATINESVLTGETMSVAKQSDALQEKVVDFFGASNTAFAGTILATGKIVGVVCSTGNNSSLGLLTTRAATVIAVRPSSFSTMLAGFSRFILYLVLISLLVICIVHVWIKGVAHVDVIELILFASALAVSVVPEALPLVMTFALSQGAVRLAQKKTVVKRLSAIEDLGNVQILCTDKTGTLTENMMVVAGFYGKQERELLCYALLAGVTSQERVLSKGFDSALYDYLSVQERELVEQYTRITEIPFDPARLRTVTLVEKNDCYELIVRGAAEVVLHNCHRLSSQEFELVTTWIEQEGKKGNRVLAVAKKRVEVTNEKSYDIGHDVAEKELDFLGIVSFHDPIKKSAFQAIVRARELGLQLKILSGDSKEVCGAVGCQLGLITDDTAVMTGGEFAAQTDEEKRHTVEQYTIFSRVTPEHKYEIIKLLQEKKDVAYLGDGINDVLALKEAYVGFAVQDAVDVAREAADIILLRKSLTVIVDGIQEGRRVFANTLKYIKINLSSNFGNFYSIALAALFIDELPMLPAQILLVNFLSDVPLISLATDTVPGDEFKRPAVQDIRSVLVLTTILGLVSSTFDLVFFALFFHMPIGILQTGWFMLNMLTELLFIFSIRTNRFFLRGGWPSKPLWIAASVSLIVTLWLPFSQFGHTLFGFSWLQREHMIKIVIITGAYFVVSEITKLMYYRLTNNGGTLKP